jgi:hypothetical protein
MKRYGWITGSLVISVVLAAVPISAQCCGGQMGQSMMGSGQMGSSGHMGMGSMGSGQIAPDYTGNYDNANPKATAPGQPTGTWVPAPSGQPTGNPAPSGHDHNH